MRVFFGVFLMLCSVGCELLEPAQESNDLASSFLPSRVGNIWIYECGYPFGTDSLILSWHSTVEITDSFTSNGATVWISRTSISFPPEDTVFSTSTGYHVLSGNKVFTFYDLQPHAVLVQRADFALHAGESFIMEHVNPNAVQPLDTGYVVTVTEKNVLSTTFTYDDPELADDAYAVTYTRGIGRTYSAFHGGSIARLISCSLK
jgi:hypothetical protein